MGSMIDLKSARQEVMKSLFMGEPSVIERFPESPYATDCRKLISRITPLALGGLTRNEMGYRAVEEFQQVSAEFLKFLIKRPAALHKAAAAPEEADVLILWVANMYAFYCLVLAEQVSYEEDPHDNTIQEGIDDGCD